jgi:hypothetical protein
MGAAVADAEYELAHARECLALDPRTHELHVELALRGDEVHLTGEVPTAERRAAVEEVAARCLPGRVIRNQVVVPTVQPAGDSEELP